MAIKGYCGIKACCDCSRGCKLDASIPCSPDCENLTHDGKILLEKCLQEKCEEVKYIFNMPDSSDEELLTKYGAVTQYPYLDGGVSVKSWEEIEKKYLQDRENKRIRSQEMNKIFSPEDIVMVIGSFYLCNDGDEASSDLIINIGAELLDISPDAMMELIATSPGLQGAGSVV